MELNIYQRLAKITAELGNVAKNLNVAGKYKAVGEVDVLNSVKPLEEKYGVYSYPVSRKIYESKEVLVGSQKTINQLLRVETVYRFVNIDKPTEFVDIVSYGDGLDSGDKAPGKAMTYADKYALLKAYKIETGDDHDKDLSPEKVQQKKKVKEETRNDLIQFITDYENQDRVIKALEYYGKERLGELETHELQTIKNRLAK